MSISLLCVLLPLLRDPNSIILRILCFCANDVISCKTVSGILHFILILSCKPYRYSIPNDLYLWSAPLPFLFLNVFPYCRADYYPLIINAFITIYLSVKRYKIRVNKIRASKIWVKYFLQRKQIPLLSTFVSIAVSRPSLSVIFRISSGDFSVMTAIEGPTELMPTNSIPSSRIMLMNL